MDDDGQGRGNNWRGRNDGPRGRGFEPRGRGGRGRPSGDNRMDWDEGPKGYGARERANGDTWMDWNEGPRGSRSRDHEGRGGANGYDKDPYRRDPYDHPPYGRGRNDPYAREDPSGYGIDDPYARESRDDPYRRDNPYGRYRPDYPYALDDPYSQDRRHDPYLHDRRENPYARDRRDDPYGQRGRDEHDRFRSSRPVDYPSRPPAGPRMAHPQKTILQQLSECRVNDDLDVELGINVITSLLKSLKEYSTLNGEPNVAAIMAETELSMGKVKALHHVSKILGGADQGTAKPPPALPNELPKASPQQIPRVPVVPEPSIPGMATYSSPPTDFT